MTSSGGHAWLIARWVGMLLPLTLLALVLPGLPRAAAAAGIEPSTLVLVAPATVRRGAALPLRATLTATGSAATISGASVTFEENVDGTWTPAGAAITDDAGTALLQVVADGTGTQYRAVFGGDDTYAAAGSQQVSVDVVVVASQLALTGPKAIVDETSGTLRISWTGSDGLGVAGPARLWKHRRGQPWQAGAALSTDAGGRAAITIRPRNDTWYQVRGAAGPGWTGDVSSTLYVDNRPPGRPVVLPAAAPKPRVLPAQRRAVGLGSAVKVTTIPTEVWTRMAGRSWRRGCPVGRSGLRYIRVNYWGFDGYRHRGELVVRDSAVGDFTRALRLLYNARIPIRSMYLPDRFGYSARSGGADDFRSMQFDNTSAFNCRWVTGRPGVRSPHSYGRAFDLNPWENPYHSAVGWLPNSWWAGHSHPRYAWRSGTHQVVRIMRESGFRWSYPRSDPQHFDA